jgi:sec-independent protein translocase protein TatC
MQFFASFDRPDIVFVPRLEPVFEMYVKMLLAMGLVFELPTAVYFLARIGLVTAGFLVRQIKYAVLVIFVVAAVATPGQDVASQFIMAGPMIVLYVISIGIAWLVGKRPSADTTSVD